jgi:hypothetical protein
VIEAVSNLFVYLESSMNAAVKPEVLARPEDGAMSEDAVLSFTQATRMGIVRELVKPGKVPEDRGQQALLMQALDGLDRQALTKKKIDADNGMATAQAQAAGIISRLLEHVPRVKSGTIIEGVTRELPLLGNAIPEPQLVPGEIDTHPTQMDFETFSRENAVDYTPVPDEGV